MNALLWFIQRRVIFHLAWALPAAAVMQAQSAVSSLSLEENLAITRSATFGQAVGLLRAGKIAEGEALLAGVNSSRSGTAMWHFESAQSLLKAALMLRGTGQAKTAILVAQRAMNQLGQTEQKLSLPADRALAAAVKHAAGVINERIVGTTETAKAYYRAAVQLDPKSPASAALARHEQADAAVATRQAVKRGPRG